jgi:hypothetical protein
MAVILTIPERRIAEAYVPVLDYVSRCALAIDRGDWFYLYDKAAELEHAAQRLSTAAHAGHKATAEPRGAAVRAFVADRSWRAGFRAGELLHPVEGLAERRAEVLRVPSPRNSATVRASTARTTCPRAATMPARLPAP